MDSSDENDGVLDSERYTAEELFDDEDENNDEGHENEQVNSEDENKDQKVKKTKEQRTVRNPRVLLNFDRLKSPHGFQALMETFEKFKFRGKNFEKEDLSAIMLNMQHWMCNHLYPGYDAETCMRALEKLGRKRVIQTHMRKMRQEAKTGFSENKENLSGSNVENVINFNDDDFNELMAEEEILEKL